MSLADSFRKKKPRPTAGADPARAFGSEELTMEEIRRQNFVPPKEKTGFARRAGSALNSLRQKIVGEDPVEKAFPDYQEPEPAPRQEAPVYSARTYQSDSAPELGWENPFTDPAPGKRESFRTGSPRIARAPRSYSEYGITPEAPVYPEHPYGYPPQGYTYPDESYSPSASRGGTYRAPGYTPPSQGYAPPSQGYTPPSQGYAPPSQGYAPNVYSDRQSYYPPESYGGYPLNGYGYPPAENGYPPNGYPPEYGYPPAGYDTAPFSDPYGYNSYGYEPYGNDPAPGDNGEEWIGGRSRIPSRRRAPKRMETGDLKYMFWSGSIVVGVLLTLTAFLYGSII